MKTEIVNIFKEPYDVYIGRAGKGKDGYFGNPFKLEKGEPKGSTLEKYRENPKLAMEFDRSGEAFELEHNENFIVELEKILELE